MKPLFVLAAFGLSATAVSAAEPSAAALAFAQSQAATWINHPAIVAAVIEQNIETAGLSEADIIAMDDAWRSEIGAASTPTISSVLDAPASAHLREHVSEHAGMITEVFVMDARGLNVASSGITSDYWQGDEAKWSETYPKGADAVHVSEIELDESTQTYQMQVSLPVTDPASGDVVGAVTFGLNAQAFF